MADISYMMPNDSVWLDRCRMDRLFLEMGKSGAQDVICRAMEAVAKRLTALERCDLIADRAMISKLSKSLGAIAEQIGLESLSRVAGDVRACACEGGDPVALGATLARLVRIGDRSLAKVWELQDLSG